MKRLITLSIVSILTALTFIGCQGSSPTTHSNKHYTQEKVHDIIKSAGEENGWKMTEFKINTLIAEKDGEAVSVTFNNSSFYVSPVNSNLESAISSALEK
ncbi:hypothetical protein [Sulfurimonas sp.]